MIRTCTNYFRLLFHVIIPLCDPSSTWQSKIQFSPKKRVLLTLPKEMTDAIKFYGGSKSSHKHPSIEKIYNLWEKKAYMYKSNNHLIFRDGLADPVTLASSASNSFFFKKQKEWQHYHIPREIKQEFTRMSIPMDDVHTIVSRIFSNKIDFTGSFPIQRQSSSVTPLDEARTFWSWWSKSSGSIFKILFGGTIFDPNSLKIVEKLNQISEDLKC